MWRFEQNRPLTGRCVLLSACSGLSNAKNAFIYGLVGALIIGAASLIVGAFMGGVNLGALAPLLWQAASMIVAAATGIFTLMVVVAGMQMLTSKGEGGGYDSAKTKIVVNGIGLIVCVSAYVFAPALLNLSPEPFIATADSALRTLGRGIGMLSVVATGFAGVLFIFSGADEGQRDKAKKILLGTSIAMGISLTVEIIIATFT
ncbi:MAG: hypothetical protein M5U15_15405 [Kiritimatiellae bacterium]|nr:hypothetical protein [Kiritimatiellia bacterium]